MKEKADIKAISKAFQLYGNYVEASEYGSGHINDTYCVVFDQAGNRVRYIFQRINHHVFHHPVALMDNISRVTCHIADKMPDVPDVFRRVLKVIPSVDGLPYCCDESGNFWRVYLFVENAKTYDAIQTPKQAFEAARAFGLFQKMLADLPSPPLHDTIPDFHHTPRRFHAFEKALNEDVSNRAQSAKQEISFVLQRKAITGVLIDMHEKGDLPLRVTHNDSKLNNVLLDDVTGAGICVIDLDTVMPGLTLYDFGDMVRTMTCMAPEDEKGLSNVNMQFPFFEAIVKGYLLSMGDVLNKNETAFLAFAGKLITFEIGLRFLTDYLAGDTYFKIHREGQNLDRCRRQFRLVESIEEQEEKMREFVRSCM
ncbi:MAG: aminoglycoside phosphotransferase family protein [Kiritimatiellae bacterium]|nr:aminoglycoside phosphotransferase family protein [Kiritimatiellia bacterium]MDD5521415.1 aminoglycoside phosphotransferase family protein [Kiritimatiellia bacterium]